MPKTPSKVPEGLTLDASTATWPEVRDFRDRCPCAILPLGATEQHGPHLPQNTDTILAEAVASRVAEQTCGLLLPCLSIGYSWVWRDFPGSMTLSFDTFRSVIKDIARGLDRQSFEALLIITAHAANPQPLKYTVRELTDELDLAIMHLCYPGLSEVMANADSEMWLPGNFHAEEFETSLMLALAPELVRMDKAVKEYPVRSIHYQHSSATMGELSQSGVFGDATAANAEKGQQWLDASVGKIAALWREFLVERKVFKPVTSQQ